MTAKERIWKAAEQIRGGGQTSAPSLPTMTAKERISLAAQTVKNGGTLNGQSYGGVRPLMTQRTVQSPTLPMAEDAEAMKLAQRRNRAAQLQTEARKKEGTISTGKTSSVADPPLLTVLPGGMSGEEKKPMLESAVFAEMQKVARDPDNHVTSFEDLLEKARGQMETSAPTKGPEDVEAPNFWFGEEKKTSKIPSYQELMEMREKALASAPKTEPEPEMDPQEVAELLRLSRIDIGAGKRELSDMEAECAELEKEFRAAEQAQNVPMDILYRDGQEAYDAAQAAADERVNAAFAAWDAKKKDVTAKKEEVEQAKAVQYYMIPTRDDFEVYAARGAAMKNNPVMSVKRSGDGAVIALEAMEKLFPKTQWASPTKSIYDKLTDQEARIYSYLLAKDNERGTNYATGYLLFMMDPMKARRGREQADLVKNSGILRPVATAGYGVASGLDRAVTGIAQNFSDTPLPAGELQYGAGYVRDDLADVGGPEIFGSNWAQIGFDLANTTGNMAPAIAASAVGGPAAGAAVTFASAGGNAYGEALAQGYDQRSARAYGVLAGASEAGLQYVLGGISSLGGKVVNSNGIQAALNNIERAVLRIPAKYAVAATGEMTEEYLQEILDPVFRNLALGENNEFKLFTEDAAYSALLAALSVGVLEGPNIVSTDISLDRMGQTLRGKWGADASGVIDVLIRMGLNQEQGSDAYQAAQAAKAQLGKGHALTNVALGSLYQNVMGVLRAEGAATIQSQTNTTAPGSTLESQTAGPTMDTTATQNPTGGTKNAPKDGTTLVNVVRRSIPQMQDMAPVAEVQGNELPAGESVIERLTAFINRIGNKVHRIGFGDVLFSKGRIKNSMLGHGMGMAKIETFTAVPEVIKHGKQVDFQENWKGRGYDTYTFAAPVIYRGEPTYMGVIVTKDIQAERYYVHEVVDADGNLIFRGQENTAATSDGRASLSGTVDTVATTVFNNSIPQPPTGVKPKYSLKDMGGAFDIEALRKLAQEMSASPPPREIPQRPVQQSPQEILTQLAREMAQDSLQGGALDGLSNEDIRAMLEEIAAGNEGLQSDTGDGILTSGAISGALNPEGKRARKHAVTYYGLVRKMTTDVARIAKNTGYSKEQIQRIKNFLFVDEHDLGGGKVARFDPSYEIAQSWQRLLDGKEIQPHDLTLLMHEILESELMGKGHTQDEAHRIASKKYDYRREAEEYYGQAEEYS